MTLLKVQYSMLSLISIDTSRVSTLEVSNVQSKLMITTKFLGIYQTIKDVASEELLTAYCGGLPDITYKKLSGRVWNIYEFYWKDY